MQIKTNQQFTSIMFSDGVQKAYDKNKDMIIKIFSLIKSKTKENNLKEEFYESYIDFSIKLDEIGFNDESDCYMDICAMYYNMIDRPDELISHKEFFMDLFNPFDELMYVKINKPEDYFEIYEKFLIYSSKMQEYYYTEVAIPSPYYNEETCKTIIGNLAVK